MKIAQAWFPHCPLTPETAAVHLAEWESIAREVDRACFEEALTCALRSSEFFPAVATIRRHAGLSIDLRIKAEGDRAWDWVQGYIRKWLGVPRIYRGRDPETGDMLFDSAPALPDRIGYAVRAVGGLNAIAKVRLEGEPFMRKEFCEAYDRAPVAARLPLQLPSYDAKRMHSTRLKAIEKPHISQEVKQEPVVKKMPCPPTDEELDTRRIELKRQAEQLLNTKG